LNVKAAQIGSAFVARQSLFARHSPASLRPLDVRAAGRLGSWMSRETRAGATEQTN
jgi:hypothetical protein